jgi:hypothetical protein
MRVDPTKMGATVTPRPSNRRTPAAPSRCCSLIHRLPELQSLPDVEDSLLKSVAEDWEKASKEWEEQFNRLCFVQQERSTAEREAARRRQAEEKEKYEAKSRKLQSEIDSWKESMAAEGVSNPQPGQLDTGNGKKRSNHEDVASARKAFADPCVEDKKVTSSNGKPSAASSNTTGPTTSEARIRQLIAELDADEKPTRPVVIAIEDIEDIPRSALPSTSYVTYLSACDKFRKRDYVEAGRLFSVVWGECERCSQLVPAVLGNRACCAYLRGRFDQALADSLAAVKLCKSHAVSYARSLRCALALRRISDARQYLKQLEAIPDHGYDSKVEAQILESVASFISGMAKGQYEAALTSISQVCVTLPSCLSFQLMRLEVLAAVRPADAFEVCSAMLEVQNGTGDVADLLYWKGFLSYERMTDPSQVSGIQSYLLRAIGAAEGNDHPKAAQLLRLLKAIETQYTMVSSFLNSQRWKEAVNVLTHLLSLDLRNSKVAAWCLYQRAIANRAAGYLDSALRDCTAAKETKVCDVGLVLGLRAELYKALGQLHNAVKDAEESCKANPTPANHERLNKLRQEHFQRQKEAQEERERQAEREEESRRARERQGGSADDFNFRSPPKGSSGNGGTGSRPRPQSAHCGPRPSASGPSEEGYYGLLGIKSNATAAQITRAYKQSALRWHPDRWITASKKEQVIAEDTFKKINHAYSILSNEESRRRYDLTL